MSKGRWPLYRWEDGAQIDIVKTVWTDYTEHCLDFVSTSKKFLLFIYANGKFPRTARWVLSTKLLLDSDRHTCAQLRGFLFDLGIRQHPHSDGMLRLLDSSPQVQTTLLGPSFVPDEVFDQRYEQIEKLWREAKLPSWETFPCEFLGVESVSLRIQQPGVQLHAKQNLGEQIWLTSEHRGLWNHVYSSKLNFHLHRLVDQLVGRIPIRPESQRAEWEADNVKRGVLLKPFAELFEVYRCLDEELPIFWKSSDFLPWVQEL